MNETKAELCKQVTNGTLALEDLPVQEDLEKEKEVFETLRKQNPLPDDDTLELKAEGHKYWTKREGKWMQDHISVSEFVKPFFHAFDAEEVSEKIVRSYRWREDSSYMYYQKPKEQIKLMWLSTAEKGTFMHMKIELFYNQLALDDHQTTEESYKCLPDNPVSLRFREFHEEVIVPMIERGMRVFRTEKPLSILRYKLAGTPDILFKSPIMDPVTGKAQYWLMDWKINEKTIPFVDQYNKKCSGPLTGLDSTKGIEFAVKMAIYRVMALEGYDVDIVHRSLVRLSGDEYEWTDLAPYSPIIDPMVRQLLNQREAEMLLADVEHELELAPECLDFNPIPKKKGKQKRKFHDNADTNIVIPKRRLILASA